MEQIHPLLSTPLIDYVDSLIDNKSIMNRTDAIRKIISEHIEAHK